MCFMFFISYSILVVDVVVLLFLMVFIWNVGVMFFWHCLFSLVSLSRACVCSSLTCVENRGMFDLVL